MTAEVKTYSVDRPAGFSPFDIHFSRFIAGLGSKMEPAVRLAAAMLSRIVRAGDSCLDLEAVAGEPIGIEPEPGVAPGLQKWKTALRKSNAVGRPGEQLPLILDAKNRLYLFRYWQYEDSLAKEINSRLSRSNEDLEMTALRRGLVKYFPTTGDGEFDWQRAAAVIALSNYFCIITGGPGTGKTFTVARLLALYCEARRHAKPRIHLAAPTGKAAAQLKASVAAAKSNLALDSEIAQCIPENVYTLHRLLRVLPGNSGFYHHARNPLPTDIVIVDEASMVDLALMSKLVQAIPPDARLILAGDKDQLASVEAGSVFGDICDRNNAPGFSYGMGQRFSALCGETLPGTRMKPDHCVASMADAIAVLQNNFRFDSDSGLGALSRAVRAGEVDEALTLLSDPHAAALQWVDYDQETNVQQQLSVSLLEGFEARFKAGTARSALKFLERFQILCALKKGPYGAEGVNRLTEAVLSRNRLISLSNPSSDNYYRGRPVIIARNDYDLQLYNGDIGLVWPDDGDRPSEFNTYFPADEGRYRKVWPNRLPAHDTVYAMTVHKSQGSEFDHVMLILPPQDYELLTCELVYTALTRARKRVTVWAPLAVLKKALGRRLHRSSGLRDALWQTESS